MSDDEVIVLRGLEEGDRVMLATPPDGELMKIARLTGPSLKPKPLSGDSARPAVLQGNGAAGTTPPTAPAGMHGAPAAKGAMPGAKAVAPAGKLTAPVPASASAKKP